jgi:hypothetical protein
VRSEPDMDPQAEVENAHAALEEEMETGETGRRCLRDRGRLILEDRGSGYVIRCENGDFTMTGRGI